MTRSAPGPNSSFSRRAILGSVAAGTAVVGMASTVGVRSSLLAQNATPAASPVASPEATPVLDHVATPDPQTVQVPEATPMTHSSGGDWPMGGGEAGRRNFSPNPGSGDDIELLWLRRIGDYGAMSHPVISNDAVYVCGPDAGGADFYPTSMAVDTILAALDLYTGEERWTMGVDIQVRNAAPVVAHDALYLVGDRGGIRVIDAHSRAMRWEAALPTEVIASPVIVDDILYINGADSTLYALDALDGSELWTFTYDAGAEELPEADPVVGNGMVYLPSGSDLSRTSLFALDATTGEERWRLRASGGAHRFAALDGDALFLFGDQVHAIDALTAETRWVSREASAGTRPVVGDDAIFTLSRGHDTIACLDRETGDIRWSESVREMSGPIVGSGHGLIVSQQSEFTDGPVTGIYAYEPGEGASRWSIPMGEIENQVAIAGDIMVVASGRSDVAAFRTTRQGEDEWEGSGRVNDVAYLSPLRFSSDKVEDEDHFVESGGFLPETTSAITVAGTIVTRPAGYLTWDVVWLINGRSMMRSGGGPPESLDHDWTFSWELDWSVMEGFRDEIAVEIRIDGTLARRGRVTLYDRGFRDQDS